MWYAHEVELPIQVRIVDVRRTINKPNDEELRGERSQRKGAVSENRRRSSGKRD
jgi:hypothetical protein